MFSRTAIHCSLLILATTGLVACGGSDDDGPTSVAVGDTIVLTGSDRLVSFNRAAPATEVGAIAVSGLASGETLLGIDMRPADGLLYALASSGTLYTLDPATGKATRKSALMAMAGDDAPYTALSGTHFAVDFNPAADRLRVVSDTGQNLRINVDTGAATTDGSITPATTRVTAAAYTNSFAGTVTTQLFGLDAAAGRLVLQDPPNDGVVNAGVPLGVLADTLNGFDIDPRNNMGYAALRVGGSTALYTIALATTTGNAATRVADIAGGETVKGLALNLPAKLQAYALTADNRLVAFDPAAPNTLTATTAITGLQAGDTVLGVDFRPKDGLLYALATGGKLYTVDPATGAATLRATLAADPSDATAPYAGLTASRYTVDFNPVADRLRAIGNDGQNLRIVVEDITGATPAPAGRTITDGVINRAGTPASVIGSAYSNSFAGTTATTLFNLDEASDVLTQQVPPNDGTQVNVGALGLDITTAAGFDIAGGGNGVALAALRNGAAGPFSLYSVTLASGATALYRNTTGNAAQSLIGGAGGPANLIDLAVRF